MKEETYKIGQVVSYRDDNGELHDGWTVNGYDACELRYELSKDGKSIWVDDTRVC